MPHDARGNVLKAGDRVIVPFIVTAVYSEDGFCNVNLESELVMPGNGSKTTLSAINTKQTYRANVGDSTEFVTAVDPQGNTSFSPV